MDTVIYTNEAGELLAKKYVKMDEFNKFISTLDESQILYYNGKVFEDNIPEKYKDEFPVFFRSLQKQWGSTVYHHIQQNIEGVEHE